MIGKENLLASIVTTKGSDWRKKLRETAELSVSECCLFLTNVTGIERKEFYRLLEKSPIKKCPLVHLRSDMSLEDVEYFVNNYHTKVFNIHCFKQHPTVHDLSKYAHLIFIENVYHPFDEKELAHYAGICLDFSHLENDRLLEPRRYESFVESLKTHRIGCNHISGVAQTICVGDDGFRRYDRHYFKNLSDFDYLKRYPREYFSECCALELENSLADQMKVRDYIAEILE